ncbi:MAG: hypothetical protein IMZ65_03245 [Planctomycetes bacterium]|nr:hypothetical protein [Planctomycetota bacterium]
MTAELPGFSRFVRDGVYVRAGLNLTVHIVMKLGAVTEPPRAVQVFLRYAF